MRIAFLYPSSLVSNPIDPANIWTDKRGLTGSEMACFMYAIELSKRGHGVTIFTNFTQGGDIGKVTCCHYGEWQSTYCRQGWDAMVSLAPEPFKFAQPGVLKIFNQQVSNFNLCEPGWEQTVDILAPLSSSHANHMACMTGFPKGQWRVMGNGVDLHEFTPGKKEPGRMIWASSHDRGLHWLLEAFPKVRNAVPHAELHVFYNSEGLKNFATMNGQDLLTDSGRHMAELAQRSRYTLEALDRLKGKGVFAHMSVSRERIRKEMGKASVLAYPCDPVHYTETFGVAVLEACAAMAVPVICTSDCFGEMWEDASVSVPPPFSTHKEKWLEKLIHILSDKEDWLRAAKCAHRRALEFRWSEQAKKLEMMIKSSGRRGFPEVCWDPGV